MNPELAWLLKEKYQGQKTTDFVVDSQRLEAGEPLAYIIGHIPFLDCTIYLDSKPLIPRTETEYWVAQLIAYLKKKYGTSPLRILDLCAGSGCIGVAVARAYQNSVVDFAEIDKDHLATITKNCIENNLSKDRYNLYESNLFSSLPENSRYDYIISNPPYIDPVVDRAESSVKKYEPAIALYGGKAGLELISKIIESAPDYLTTSGELWLEHEPEQAKTIDELANNNFRVVSHIDQYQVIRFTQLVLQ